MEELFKDLFKIFLISTVCVLVLAFPTFVSVLLGATKEVSLCILIFTAILGVLWVNSK